MNNRIETVFNKYGEEEFIMHGLKLCFISTKSILCVGLHIILK